MSFYSNNDEFFCFDILIISIVLLFSFNYKYISFGLNYITWLCLQIENPTGRIILGCKEVQPYKYDMCSSKASEQMLAEQ